MGTLLPNARTICLFIYFFSSRRLLCGAVDLGAEPFVLWSNKEEYWFIGVRQLPFASCSSLLFRFTIWSPGRKVCFTDAERTALCCCTVHVSNDTQTSDACMDWAFISKSSRCYWLGALRSCANIFRSMTKQAQVRPLLLGNVAFPL